MALLELHCTTLTTYALVGSIGLEPTTPTMSRWCSNQLSYEPAENESIASLSFRLQDPHHIFYQSECALQLRGLRNLGGELHPGNAFAR